MKKKILLYFIMDTKLDLHFYKKFYSDMSKYTDKKLNHHYKKFGCKEGRFQNQKELDDFLNVYNLDLNFYRSFYPDLTNFSDSSLVCHFKSHGIKEKRFRSEQHVIETIGLENYENLLQQVINSNLKLHNLVYLFNSKENKVIHSSSSQDLAPAKNLTKEPNDKLRFRELCLECLPVMRYYNLPLIQKGEKYEAVLIEYRKFPHVEFLIRNAILKLGTEWSFTVICGNLNYEFMKKLCHDISPSIKVIHTNYDNLNQTTYSEFMATVEFWEMFQGEKILIYQEDSCIFYKNIQDFLSWDYIGAPWPKTQDDNPNCVGNGGFSLRTKQCMIDTIKTVSIQNSTVNSHTANYMKNTGMTIVPEDVYFSLNMILHNIGKVADWDSANKFSSESFFNPNAFGGHNFWINCPNWENHVKERTIIQLHPMYDTLGLDHRGGWKTLLEIFIKTNLYSLNSNIVFFDILEKYFLWEDYTHRNQKWIGIIHCTQKTPEYLNNVNISFLFEKPRFFKALKECVFILVLSDYVAEYLREKFQEFGHDIKVYVLKHPVVDEGIPLFTIEKWKNNKNKTLVQVGQQLRKLTSIYTVKTDLKKLWLTGTKNLIDSRKKLQQEIEYFGINDINVDFVKMHYTNTFEEYDKILSENIVFVHLFDASANNTVLECIVRNTPIIINKLPAVVEYLGEDYPMYFTDLDEVDKLLTIENIEKAHDHLKGLNKDEYKLDNFIKNFYTLVYENIQLP